MTSLGEKQPEADESAASCNQKGDMAPDSTPSMVPQTPATQPKQSPGTSPAADTHYHTALIMFSLGIALFLAALDITIVTTAIPTIVADFRSSAGYTWIGSAYLLANAAAAPMWGSFSDIWGRKKVLLTAVAIFWIGSLLSAVSTGIAMLIVGRSIQGLGGGGIVILVNVCVSDMFSMRERGFYLGLMSMAWSLAGSIGPVLGGVFTSKATWRWCFYVNLPIAGVAFLILVFFLKIHNPRTPLRQGLAAVDWVGSLTILAGVLMLLLGLEFGGVTFPWSSAKVICLIVFGLVTVAIFVLVQLNFSRYPIMPPRLFAHTSSVAAFGVCACHALVFISASYYLPLYFQAVLRATPLLSGVYLLPFSISTTLTSVVTGMLIRFTGRYLPLLTGGMAVLTLGFGLLIDLPFSLRNGATSGGDWAKIVLYQIVCGIGVGPNFQAPLIALQTRVPPSDIASATGTLGFIRQLGLSISVVIGSVVFDNQMQKQYPSLRAALGADLARKLTGANAAANVATVAALTGNDGDIARTAYGKSLRTMHIMFTAFAGLGLLISLFVGSRVLTNEHTEHKTGLATLKEREGTAKERKQSPVARDGDERPTDEEVGQDRTDKDER